MGFKLDGKGCEVKDRKLRQKMLENKEEVLRKAEAELMKKEEWLHCEVEAL